MQYCSARHQDRELRADREEMLDLWSGGHDLLEVVEQQQHVLVLQRELHQIEQWEPFAFFERQSLRNGGQDQLWVNDGASDMKVTPSTKSSARSEPTCTARRVVPTPPLPVSVTRRMSERSRRLQIVATSCSRPISGVNCIGREARMPDPELATDLGLNTICSSRIVKDPP